MTYRRLNLDLVLAIAVVVVERLVHHQDALDGVAENEGVVVVAALMSRR